MTLLSSSRDSIAASRVARRVVLAVIQASDSSAIFFPTSSYCLLLVARPIAKYLMATKAKPSEAKVPVLKGKEGPCQGTFPNAYTHMPIG